VRGHQAIFIGIAGSWCRCTLHASLGDRRVLRGECEKWWPEQANLLRLAAAVRFQREIGGVIGPDEGVHRLLDELLLPNITQTSSSSMRLGELGRALDGRDVVDKRLGCRLALQLRLLEQVVGHADVGFVVVVEPVDVL